MIDIGKIDKNIFFCQYNNLYKGEKQMKHQTIEEVQNRISYLENVYTDARNATLLKKPLDDETEYYCLKPTEVAYKILGRAYIRNEIHNLK